MKIILTEEQFKTLVNEDVISEGIIDFLNGSKENGDIKSAIRRLLYMGASLTMIIAALSKMGYSRQEEMDLLDMNDNNIENTEYNYVNNPSLKGWTLISDKTTATVYNAVPEQCNKDIRHTASNFTLNLNDVLSHKIIAMERTMMQKNGLHYGDVVRIVGTGKWDGVWQIQDTMNKKFAGMDKIDILVPNNIKKGKWDNVKVYKIDKSSPDSTKIERACKSQMAI